MPPVVQRIVLTLVVLVVGWFALPLSAALLDRWLEGGLLVVALLLAAVVCGGAGALLPGAAGRDATRLRGALVGAAGGMVMAVVSTIVLFLIIAG